MFIVGTYVKMKFIDGGNLHIRNGNMVQTKLNAKKGLVFRINVL
jgi:hypothetical protein